MLQHDRQPDPIDLPGVLTTLGEGRRWVVATVAASVALTAAYSFSAPPIYRADALLQVDYRSKAMDPLKDSVTLFSAESPAETEIGIIRSRLVVGEVLARFPPRTERAPFDATNDFLANLTVTEKGRNTGIIQVQLLGPDRQRVGDQLNALLDAYVQQDVKGRAAEAESRLRFVESQLPLLKVNVDEAERRLQRYRSEKERLGMAVKAQSLADRAARIDSEERALDLALPELRQRFANSHPNVLTLNTKRARLEAEKRKVAAEAETLPEAELNWLRLSRDVKVASSLYEQLLAKAQELTVWKSGTIGSVRVVDHAAVSAEPASPKKALNLALALAGGLMTGVTLAMARTRLRPGSLNLAGLERAFNLPVYAYVAHSPRERTRTKAIKRGETGLEPLARAAPSDRAVEALRVLRASLEYALSRSPNNVVLLASSKGQVGRSFVAMNLSCLMAASGKRVLLVDGDLRAGPLSRSFPKARSGGLAALIDGAELDQCVFSTSTPLLDFLPAGAPASSEKLWGVGLAQAMEAASARYDLVLVVAPPVLEFADATALARAAGMTFLVVKEGAHSRRELALTVERLRQSGAAPSGFIANCVLPNAAA